MGLITSCFDIETDPGGFENPPCSNYSENCQISRRMMAEQTLSQYWNFREKGNVENSGLRQARISV
jgi:hypothetical protein